MEKELKETKEKIEEINNKNNTYNSLNMAENKYENQKNEKLFENNMGFSAFISIPKNDEKNINKNKDINSNTNKSESKIEKKEKEKENKKQNISNVFGITLEENTKPKKEFVKTKIISEKEAKELNQIYKNKINEFKKRKNDEEKKRKKDLQRQEKQIKNRPSLNILSKIKSFFNKKRNSDIIKNNPKLKELREEIKKEKKYVTKLFRKKEKDEFIKDFKVDLKNAGSDLKEETVENIKNTSKLLKKNTINLIKTNILNEINRRKNILNLFVFIPIIVLLSINISLIKEIVIVNKAINNATKLKTLTENLNVESEQLEKELEDLKKSLVGNQEAEWKDGQIEEQQ